MQKRERERERGRERERTKTGRGWDRVGWCGGHPKEHLLRLGLARDPLQLAWQLHLTGTMAVKKKNERETEKARGKFECTTYPFRSCVRVCALVCGILMCTQTEGEGGGDGEKERDRDVWAAKKKMCIQVN